MMHGRGGATPVIFIPVLAAMLAGLGTGSAKAPVGQRIYVAAFRNSRLFTCCLPDGNNARRANFRQLAVFQLPDGLVRALPMGVLASPVSPFSDLFQFTRPILDRLSPPQADEILKRKIEAAFGKEQKHTLVSSPEASDVVLLAEGLYLPERGMGGLPPLSGAVGPSSLKEPNFLAACMAVAVRAEVFVRGRLDGASLIAARTWEGSVFFRSASGTLLAAAPEELVRQFHRGKTRSAADPLRVCAVAPLQQISGDVSPSCGPSPPAWKPAEPGPLQPSSAITSRPAGESTIRVTVSLVSVPVIASDAQGRFLPDLKESNFRLFEDGVEQKIDRFLPATEPFRVVLLMDTSGSTRFKHSDIQQAALAFVSMLRPGDRLMVVSFDSRIYLDSEFTGDPGCLRNAIMQTQLGTNTRLYDAVQLVVADRLSRIPGRKAIVLFTDGVDNASRLTGAAGTLSTVQESDVMIYAVQYGTASSPLPAGLPPSYEPRMKERSFYPEAAYARATRYLQELAEASGGRCFPAETLVKIRAAFSHIAEELRRQYTLYYYPARPPGDGSFRNIRVSIDIPGTRVRARRGYRAGGTPVRQPENHP